MKERAFVFVGVSTASSSIMRIFPRWREVLGLGEGVEIEGLDLEVGSPDSVYREAVERLARDPRVLGALVTTHKLGIYRAARDLFDDLDENAALCEEISCIAKRDRRLGGWAKDPVAAGKAISAFLADDHFRSSGGEALCMGAGGSGVAISVHLLARRGDRPRRLVVTDTSVERLSHLAEIVARLGDPPAIELVSAGEGTHERLLAGLPPHSLVVNATGMGKDRPGSPIGDEAVLPERGVAWELNYRGELDFLRQAERQRGRRRLRVEDGWSYFIRGWSAVIEEVFARPIADSELELLAEEAEFARPRRVEAR